jgi:hypothetical protein
LGRCPDVVGKILDFGTSKSDAGKTLIHLSGVGFGKPGKQAPPSTRQPSIPTGKYYADKTFFNP